MAHESFEDPATAEQLNASFVCIKVDREERPDVDAVYMEAVQAMTGSGGWPMSVFLAPDRRPFFGGTYFPPEGRHGGPSFRTVLTALTDVWDNRRDEVEEQAGELAEAIGSRSVLATGPGDHSTLGALRGGDDGPDLVEAAVADLARRFDATWGGFGPAPKFPQPTSVELCLRRAGRHPDDHQALRMATTTLDAMAAGGIHDHLGGGFARYATDPEWLVPHFEKMLYDQAGLLRAYLHGWQATGRPDYLRVVEGIVGLRDRRPHRRGGRPLLGGGRRLRGGGGQVLRLDPRPDLRSGGTRAAPIRRGRWPTPWPGGSPSPRPGTSRGRPSSGDRWAPPSAGPPTWSWAGPGCSRPGPGGSDRASTTRC